MSSAQFSPVKQALTWSLENELLSREQLGLVEVAACAPATNGSTTSRFEALAGSVPTPGVTSEVLDQALNPSSGISFLILADFQHFNAI